MKKIVLFAATFIFSFAVMAQTESKQPTTPKVARSLSTKQKTVTPVKTVETVPVKETKLTDATQTQPTQPTQPQPSPDEFIKINSSKHDFGKIPQGKPVTYSFQIKNITDKPIVVENTYASCGCTTPDKIVEPIAPGATVPLKVQYSAAGVGPFSKQVHIKLAGIAQEKVVDITGEVLAPETPATPPVNPPKPNN